MAIIDPEGLYNGKRLRRCGDAARLAWPYLFLASNGFGRLECDVEFIVRSVFGTFHEPPAEDEVWSWLEEYSEHHLLFLYEFEGVVWGQWDCKQGSLPRWKTVRDRESPSPPEPQYSEWLKSYRVETTALPKTHKVLERIVHGLGVGEGKARQGVGEAMAGRSESSAGGAGDKHPLHERYFELVSSWPESDRRGVDLGAQRWILLVDSGEIGYVGNATASSVEEILAGLDRWKNSDMWARDGGKYIPAIATYDGRGWLDKRAWKDHPKPANSDPPKQEQQSELGAKLTRAREERKRFNAR